MESEHYFWPLLKDLGFVVSFNLNNFMPTFYHFAESDVDGDTLLQMSIYGSMEQLASVGLIRIT